MRQVVKRDGRVKEFDITYIVNALRRAYTDVYPDLYNNSEVTDRYYNVMLQVLADVELLGAKCNDIYDIEDIQDCVIAILGEMDPPVYKSYSEYRTTRTEARESKSKLLESINKIIDQTNHDVLKENSNKQSQLASTQRDLIAGEVSKAIARKIIPKHIIEAHDKGLIKIHDLDYYMQGIYNCELVNIKDMLQNGTVINKKKIDTPKSLRTAMTLVTQIAAQVSSSTYGGQTISLSHIAPFVRVSEEKIRAKNIRRFQRLKVEISDAQLEAIVMEELMDEIKDSVQTFNYQISTIMTTNGQSPFISLCIYLAEDPEYVMETAMLAREFFKQRITGMENEHGVVATQTFPKLLYFLDENNAHTHSEYYWLTELAAKSTAIRMNPDYISVKKMLEIQGYVYPPMGCRAFLSPFTDAEGNVIFYGRGNLGAQTINLPYVALESGGDINKFWNGLDDALDLVRQMCSLRYDKLKGVKADSAPILWQYGAISRLNYDDDVLKAVDERGFTVTIGYSGIYETVKYLTGESHTSEKGFALAEEIMKYLNKACKDFKEATPHLRFALYGTPQESTTGWFSDKLKEKFGEIKDITDKGWLTNSYHVDIREEIDAFTKLDIESKLQSYSTGGAVSYVETVNLSKNVPAVLEVIDHIYDKIMYAEINFESDICGVCKHQGVMDNDPKTLNWVCPQCGNDDQKTLSVVRRTCGYLGETEWTDGRKLDLLNRVKHL